MTTESITSAAMSLPPHSGVALAGTLLQSVESESGAPAARSQLFERNVQEWKREARLLSSSAKMAMLRPYQRIIGLGPPAIPLILKELQREPDHWFWAPEALSGENPVPAADRGNLAAMTRAWLEWGRRHGHIAT